MQIDRHILCQLLEAAESALGPEVIILPSCGADELVTRHHLQVLVDGGYLSARRFQSSNVIGFGLTLAGQTLLDGMRTGPTLAATFAESVQRVVTGVIVAVLMAKARAAGLLLHG